MHQQETFKIRLSALAWGCGLVAFQATKLAPMLLMMTPFGSGARAGTSAQEVLDSSQVFVHPLMPSTVHVFGPVPAAATCSVSVADSTLLSAKLLG